MWWKFIIFIISKSHNQTLMPVIIISHLIWLLHNNNLIQFVLVFNCQGIVTTYLHISCQGKLNLQHIFHLHYSHFLPKSRHHQYHDSLYKLLWFHPCLTYHPVNITFLKNFHDWYCKIQYTMTDHFTNSCTTW